MQTIEKSKSSDSVLMWTLIIGAIIGIALGIVFGAIIPSDPKPVLLCIVVGALFGAIMIIFILFLINLYSSSAWFCNSFGWHRNRDIEFTKSDGCSDHGDCKRCGATDLMQDSQGNWF